MAAFVVFLLVGIHAPWGHAMPRTQNFGQAPSWLLVPFGMQIGTRES